MPLWQRGVFVRREHCEVLTRVLLQYRSLLRFSCSWSKLEAEICRIAVRNIVSAGRMLDARKRGLGGRGGRRQAVSAAFIAFSNRGPPKKCPPGLCDGKDRGPRALGASARRIAAYAALCQAEARGRDRWALCAQHAGGLLRVMAWLGLDTKIKGAPRTRQCGRAGR